jgi:SNF2 family DNA or RNA helicase
MIISTTCNLAPLHNLQQHYENNGPWASWDAYKHVFEISKNQQIASFDTLASLNTFLNIQPMAHQMQTAEIVLKEMHGRAILGDEVGLGKTIEAGLILKEYIIRGLVGKALILVPASLVLQWVKELNEKFGITAIAQKKSYVWSYHNIVVGSIETAKKEPHRTFILEQDYDILIIDEAHKLKNPRTLNYQFVNQIQKKYCLLLTATPVQNDLNELIHLVNLIKPGHLQPIGQKSNVSTIKQKLQSVMIRNRRVENQDNPIKRVINNIPLQLSTEELQLYDGVCSYIREYAHLNPQNGLALITLQREVCSSRDAVFITLVNLFQKTPENAPQRASIWTLVEKIKAITSNTKAEKTLEVIREIQDKVIIFTEYRATQQYLLHYLKQHNIQAIPYQGGMGRGKKEWMTDLFRGSAQVLVATEAGGEGINLQFCNHIINFDLPWNPMRIEQRIGRIHRYGQTKDVNVFNLITNGTIEAHIVSLLMGKIELFKDVIGELDPILTATEKSIERLALDLIQNHAYQRNRYETRTH